MIQRTYRWPRSQRRLTIDSRLPLAFDGQLRETAIAPSPQSIESTINFRPFGTF